MNTTNILFWNVNRKDICSLVCEAAIAVNADIIVLVENSLPTKQVLPTLRSKVSTTFSIPAATPGRFQVFSRNPDLDLQEVYGGDRISLRRLHHAGVDLLLGIVHLVDKMNWDANNQAAQVQLLAQEIHSQEDLRGHLRTVILGDFNMNPFDSAMNMAPGMNAMMSKNCVRRGERKLQGKKYRYFYNPMWSLFGDNTPGPPGTFYHSVSSQGIFGWNMLDQVLIRPSAIRWFSRVEILTSAGSTSLCRTSMRPNKSIGSDHLPIVLTLK